MAIDYLKARNGSSIPLWVPINEVESQALDQLRNVADLPWVARLAAMPDIHAGKGATIGTVIGMREAVSPSAVGVDIGCVDCETEFLTPTGWKRIDQYKPSDLVLQYNLKDGTARFLDVVRYIKQPCDSFWRIRTKYGVDQKLSGEHTVLYTRYDRSYTFAKTQTVLAVDLAAKHNDSVNGFRGRFITTFTPVGGQVEMSDENLRVGVMVAADGCIRNEHTGNCTLKFKKRRKIERARLLLADADTDFTERSDADGTTTFSFTAPNVGGDRKTLAFWGASVEQLRIIASEVFYWDGNLEDQVFFTRNKASADFVSYAFAATGRRSVMREDVDASDGKIDYRVFAHDNTKVGINGSPKTPIQREPSTDGFKYCFTTMTGYWVMRRGGVIAVTGNCGMGAVCTNLDAGKVKRRLPKLRAEIEARIPIGFSSHTSPAYNRAPGELKLEAEQLFSTFGALASEVQDHIDRAKNQLGTLGGGNHFIELSLDADKNVWLMLHSGSRWIGKELADVHILKAMALGHNAALPDKALAVFLADTAEFVAYWTDLCWAQRYAALNRKLMLWLYEEALRDEFWPGLQFEAEPIWCHHNYVALEPHGDEDLFVTRKGAIRAQAGDLGIIPGAMGAASYIVRGRGCEEALRSAPHGAGRKMSRGAAKRKFTQADIDEQTAGVECKKDKSIIDELRGAYKPIKRVMTNSAELVEVVVQLDPALLCVKG